MANSVYLSNISTNKMPKGSEWETMPSSQEYQAKTGIPMFWLCMFSAEHITLPQNFNPHESTDAYPFLIAEDDTVLTNLSRRRLVIACLDPARLTLYDLFCKRIAQATQNYWLLRTDDMALSMTPETLEAELLRSFAGLDDYVTALLNKDAARMGDHWMTAWLSNIKQHPETYTDTVLMGSSTDHSLPEVKSQGQSALPEKKWWQFRK
jgi:hypothetical protein